VNVAATEGGSTKLNNQKAIKLGPHKHGKPGSGAHVVTKHARCELARKYDLATTPAGFTPPQQRHTILAEHHPMHSDGGNFQFLG
jgi:hypothetical protein